MKKLVTLLLLASISLTHAVESNAKPKKRRRLATRGKSPRPVHLP